MKTPVPSVRDPYDWPWSICTPVSCTHANHTDRAVRAAKDEIDQQRSLRRDEIGAH